jgi:hypothetical protein
MHPDANACIHLMEPPPYQCPEANPTLQASCVPQPLRRVKLTSRHVLGKPERL